MTLKHDDFPSSAAFEQIASVLSASETDRKDALKTGNAIFAFNIKNKDGKQEAWHVDLKESGTVGKGVAPEGKKADVTLTLPDEEFGKLVQGKANAQKLFMSGKLKIKGNVMKATKCPGTEGEVVGSSHDVFESISAPDFFPSLSMQNDLHKTFGEIFKGDIHTFRKQLLEIQEYRCDRRKSEEWVANLRFLDISRVPEFEVESKQGRRLARAELENALRGRRAPSHEIRITRREDDDGEDKYIAVSWRWLQPNPGSSFDIEQPPAFHYQIKRPDERPLESEFPDHYMDRVVRFAQSKRITKLWIDKECIYQRPGDGRRDKDLGLQIMDVVYGDSAHSVGLLQVELLEQQEIDILSDLLRRSVFVDPEDMIKSQLQPKVNVLLVQMLILRILSDPRWSRGWIFQEDHLASHKMVLLVPCDKKLDKPDKPDGYDFGYIPGELQIKLADFRRAVTMFCLATSTGTQQRWPNTEILAKAKQYNIWNRQVYNLKPAPQSRFHFRRRGDDDSDNGRSVNYIAERNGSDISSYPTTTASVLEDIKSRCLESEADRIAILANCLRCTKRLNTQKGSPLIKPEAYSLSAALLTIILMNGEILANMPRSKSQGLPSEESLMRHTLQSYLNACIFLFTAPKPTHGQSFVDRCRFSSPKLTPRGLEARGFLFKLSSYPRLGNQASRLDPLRLTDADRETLSRTVAEPKRWGQKLDNLDHQIIKMLIEKLERIWPHGKLAGHLDKYILLDKSPSRAEDENLSAQYALAMIYGVCQALRNGHELCFAQLASAASNGEPLGIFIRPEPHGWITKTQPNTSLNGLKTSMKIFTSWHRGRNQYDKERLTGLEVSIWDEKGVREEWNPQNCSMRIHGWVNGVWTARGEKMQTYVFPLPGITKEPRCGEQPEKNPVKKRKIGDGGYTDGAA
ncbi:sterol-binding-like protein [Stemphylium lycopersici]|uniref:Sterol-binding-like protein n=1 Tax=Stemphylium lycopersici TaxID=183478 RepID=A0A364MX44_STELY|nr:sterol-binding-like protein [Stemphylium lycopersici]RAR03458.1 sterol-binding-like protein [Stemphylium lycopersici]RAR06244.1 sterol-binding-like protein [Stemphylium lycopersici]